MISRREFLISAASAGIMGMPRILSCAGSLDRLPDLIQRAPRARYWTSTAVPAIDCLQCHNPDIKKDARAHAGKPAIVKCLLCAQGCIIRPGERGKCRVRINFNGELRTLSYGRPVAIHADPIEKKPFYHFLPGSEAFSFATSGCPLHCKFCQNWELSQSRPEDFGTKFVSAGELVAAAAGRRSPVLAFTYNEPTVFMEYLSDVAALARKQKMRSVLVSCGFMNADPLKEMCSLLDGIKIDLKGYSQDFYRNVCGAELRPVLNSIRQIARSGVHLEIVNLVVPTLNDSDKMLNSLADWITGEIGPDVPVHFTRFHPDYQLLHLPPTPVATLERARSLAMSKGIRYVYIGNVPDHSGNHTYCPKCGKAVIRRSSFFVTDMSMENGKCKFCGGSIAGVWN